MLLGQNVRNHIINANFPIWQRGASFNFTTQVQGYTADRMFYAQGSDGGTTANVTVSRAAYPLPNRASEYIMSIANSTQGTSLGTNSYHFIAQRIEDVRTLAGKKVTFSFMAATNIPGKKINAQFAQVFGSGGSANTLGGVQVTLTGGETPTRYDVTFDIPSLSGKVLGTNHYLSIALELQSGATRAAGYGLSAVSWQGTGNIDIYWMQLNEGPACDFQLYAGTVYKEIPVCQRYYETIEVGLEGYQAASNNVSIGVVYPVRKRINPAVALISGTRSGLTTSTPTIENQKLTSHWHKYTKNGSAGAFYFQDFISLDAEI